MHQQKHGRRPPASPSALWRSAWISGRRGNPRIPNLTGTRPGLLEHQGKPSVGRRRHTHVSCIGRPGYSC